MKATLTKKIKIQEATAYLVLQKEEKRPDIVDFLNGKRFDNAIVNDRVKKYLQGIHLIDRQGNITGYGSQVIESGNVLAKEEGKYQIFFTQDYFLKDTILYFNRQSPNRPNQRDIKPLNIDFKEDHYYLPIDNEYSKIKLDLTKEIEGELDNRNKPDIQLQWNWNNLNESNIQFSGKLNNKEIKKNDIPLNIGLKHFIEKLFDDWDTDKEKLKIHFSEIENKENFRINKNGNAFDFHYHFEQIAIMPYDKQEAIKWRNWFINKEINESYYLKYDFEKLIKETNNKKGFSDYQSDLDIPEVKEYRELTKKKDRTKQSKSFWHLSAPLDLNPDNTGAHIIKQLDYKEGLNASFSHIVSNLIDNTSNNINHVFYYDKYTYSQSQQKKLNAFFESFEELEEIQNSTLITVKNLKGKKRADLLNSNIKTIDINSIVKKAPHNRYIVLAEDKDNYTLWQLPSSIDYIHFNENKVNSSTIGVIGDSTSFSKVEKEMLKKEVRTYIEKNI